MMKISSDFADLLSALNEESAEYLVIGALAVGFHGSPRGTADFYVWVSRTVENVPRVYRALAKFRAPLDDVSEADLLSDDLVLMIGVVPHCIDLLTSISGVTFEDAWPHRVRGKLGGVETHFLGLDELIKNKLSSGRDKDLVDARRRLRIKHDKPQRSLSRSDS